MLLLATKIKKTPILSLQTGSQIALIGDAIVNPEDLSIIAYETDENQFSNERLLIRVADLRELSQLGFIIDSGEEFVKPEDVIKINDILKLNFKLEGLKVIDQDGNKVGTIIDYTISLANFSVQQLIVKRPLLKSLNVATLTIHRNQITEIDDEKIIIKSELESTPRKRSEQYENFVPNYVNPFR